MKKDSNFKKALNELLNLDSNNADQVFEGQKETESISGQTDEEKAQRGNSQDNQFSEVPYAQESVAEGSGSRDARPVSKPPVPYNGEFDVDKPYSRVEKPVYEAVITPDIVINGDIIAGSNLKMLGKVFGNVECEGAIVLSGNIEGDVKANRLRFVAGGIQGNVSVKDNITAEQGTSIRGDVNAGSAVLSGKVQGELNVQENLELRETSSVIGNIKALGVAIFNGCRIKGMLDVGGDLKEVSADNEA